MTLLFNAEKLSAFATVERIPHRNQVCNKPLLQERIFKFLRKLITVDIQDKLVIPI